MGVNMVIAMRRHSRRQCLMRAMASGRCRAVDDGRDRLPDPFGSFLDLAVPDMGVAHGHGDIAVTEQAGDDRQGNAVHRCLAGYRMTEVMQTDIFDPGLAPDTIPEQGLARSRTGRVLDGRKQPRTIALRHATLDDLPGRGIQKDGSRSRLAVGEFEPVAFHFLPAQAKDLASAAAGQQQQADDVGLLRFGG